jgi:superfamily I DNA and/or RNA helicase
MSEVLWSDRSVLLSYQHRMHPEISAFPRDTFYESRALRDANTLQERDTKMGWFFGAEYPTRRTWINVSGREQSGVNRDEIEAIRKVLLRWKSLCRGPQRDGKPWEIACLAFYNRQELALRDMLRDVSEQRNQETRFTLPHTEIVCATVDRFQGREANLVLLSFRNTNRIGYLDSPNRLNVAITRARNLLLVVGKHSFYAGCDIEELKRLAISTPVVKP